LLICKRFLPSWDPLTSTQLASNNEPCGTITSIQSDDYPQAAQIIKKFFPPNPLAQAFTHPLVTPGTSTFQLPGKLDKESVAKKGITKLILLLMCAEINFKESTFSNMTFVALSNGMEVVLSHPWVSYPTCLADLICQTLLMTKEQDHLSIRSKYLSIQVVGKTLAAHMLSGNFATNRVTTLNNEANSINPSGILPQRNACLVEQMRMRDMIANMEKSMDVLDAHKSKAKTSITRIGTMVSVVNFSSLCINMDLIITAITTADSPPPILCQFLMKFIRIINSTEWARWYNAPHVHMPVLHWHCYSFLKRVFNHMANFATNFGNVNVASEDQPLLELNTQPLIHAITTMRAFDDNIILHHSLAMPIVIMAFSFEAYTSNPWNKMNSCNNAHPDASHKSSIPGPKPVLSNGNKVPCISVEDKHNTKTPESRSKPSSVQHKKSNTG
jgi:hypothetical protein